ncbi:hypothetical protein CMO88_04195 [Candidatus Woesearchaeota archaeon]|nr:hypothetical protein [Candidatus Woesearchaeota archaeon]|tara:strand:- start:11123 stop:11518 length:396 start_codon:yes stop_codon:yes gene_type:complete
MKLVFDTSILVGIDRNNASVIEALKELVVGNNVIYTTTLNFSEFYYGYLNKPANFKERALKFLNKYKLLTFTKESAKIHAELSYKQDKQGNKVGEFDLLTAAIAIEKNAVLVTTDKDFEKITELKKKVITV